MKRFLFAVAATLLLVTGAAQAQLTYLAFGDSLTQGIGDDVDLEDKGYPPRLEQLLTAAGEEVVVLNRGRAGETTAEGLSRIDEVLAESTFREG